MKVYKHYYFNIVDKCKYTHSLEEIHRFFNENNITYNNVAFKVSLDSLNNSKRYEKGTDDYIYCEKDEIRTRKTIDSILNSYPEMKEYCKVNKDGHVEDISNYNGFIYTDFQDDIDFKNSTDVKLQFEKILLKYPRTYNFLSIDYFLYKINFGNNIIGHMHMHRSYNDGNKITSMCLLLESNKNDEMIDTSAIIENIGNYFQAESTPNGTSICLSTKEKDDYEKIKLVASEKYDRIVLDLEHLFDLNKDYTCKNTIPGKFSGAKWLNKKSNMNGYSKPSYASGTHSMDKTDKFNNTLSFEVDITPMGRVVRPILTYFGFGYTFHFKFCCYTPANQEEFDNYMIDISYAVNKLETRLLEIGELYPEYPIWII